MGEVNQNPLTPPVNPNAPPGLDPNTGEMAQTQPQPQAPQAQQPAPPSGAVGQKRMGFLETIRSAAANNPQQFYNILSHLAAGAGPQQFNELNQQQAAGQLQQQQIGMRQEQFDANEAYRQQQLQQQQKATETENARYVEAQRQRDENTTRGLQKWAAGAAPGAHDEWIAENGPLTVNNASEYISDISEKKYHHDMEAEVNAALKEIQRSGNPATPLPPNVEKYINEVGGWDEALKQAKITATMKKEDKEALVRIREEAHTRRMAKMDKEMTDLDKEAKLFKFDDATKKISEDMEEEIKALRGTHKSLVIQLEGLEASFISGALGDRGMMDRTADAVEKLSVEIDKKVAEYKAWLNDRRTDAGLKAVPTTVKGNASGVTSAAKKTDTALDEGNMADILNALGVQVTEQPATE